MTERVRGTLLVCILVGAVALSAPASGQKPDAGQPSSSQDEILPPDFRGRISYSGTHEGEVSRAGPPLRSLRTRDIIRSATGGRTQQHGGRFDLELIFDGPSVTGRFSGTGGINSGTMTGTRNGSRCRLVDERFGNVTEAECTRSRFSGGGRHQGPRETTTIRLDAYATHFVDAVEEERQQALASANAEAERQRQAAERQREADAERARLAAAPRATPAQVALLERAVRDDLPHWGRYTYDAGSLRDVRVIARSATNLQLRGNYSFNGGTAGWVRGEVSGGRVTCVEYSDAVGCNPPRPAQTAVAGQTSRPTGRSDPRYNPQLVEALRQDSGSWATNSLRADSARGVGVTGRDENGVIYRVEYIYDGFLDGRGATGWVEGYFVGGELQTIRYHDNENWREVRTDMTRRMAADQERRDRYERCRARANADGLDTFVQCGWSGN